MSVFDRFWKIIGYNKFLIWENESSAKKINMYITNAVGVLHRSIFVKTLRCKM
jgi:hypothetical protein